MANNEFLRQFHERTEDKYLYLKLSEVEVDVPAECIHVRFVYPEDKRTEVDAARETLAGVVRGILKSGIRVEVHFTLSHFDEQFFLSRMIRFFDKYPTIAPYVYAESVAFRYDEDIMAVLSVGQSVCDMIVERGLDKKFQHELDQHYCEPVRFALLPTAETDAFDSIDAYVTNTPLYELEDDSGRYITVKNPEEIVGGVIYERARYIADCTRQGTGIVICGKIEDFKTLRARPKEDQTEGNKFYKFTLTDITGSMNCLFFPGKKYAELDLEQLIANKEVILKGELKSNTYQNTVTLDFWARGICICQLPEDIKENKIIRLVAERYTTVFPQPYIRTEQLELFQQEEEPPQSLIGKRFCVVDIETTGLDPRTAKIIEIGAVSIVDGRICETFMSYIDPGIPLSEETTRLTSITDTDVFGAPKIDEVLPDLQKFADGCIIVGQNIAFDLGFLNAAGRPVHIEFASEPGTRLDTITLARQKLKNMPNFQLASIAKRLGVENKHAHRAIYDALATAEIFIKLSREKTDSGAA